MSDTIINVENISKLYRLGEVGTGTLSHDLNRWWHRVRGKEDPYLKIGQTNDRAAKRDSDYVWALKDIDFEVKRGEVLGIIGRNGAGKSTLLKILSRVTAPSSGQVKVKGRIASLLEVGTGFHPELTGRDNIYLNGAILGMRKREIDRKFDEIVAFAEVERYIDTPVKRYSSGMYVRLAFAVAAHLEPEILIVDEVLAVGDVEFQKKCLGKMQDVSAKEGRTVLFVSHNMAAVNRLCQTGILMEKGAIVVSGNVDSVVARYLQSDTGDKTQFIPDPGQPTVGNETAALLALTVKGGDGSAGPTFISNVAIKVEIICRVFRPTRGLRVGFHLHGADGTIVFNTADTDGDNGTANIEFRNPGVYTSICEIPGSLLNRGQYSITVGSDTPTGVNFYRENAVSFFVVPGGTREMREDNRPGLVCPRLSWEVEKKAEIGRAES